MYLLFLLQNFPQMFNIPTRISSPGNLRSIEQELSKLSNFLSNILCYVQAENAKTMTFLYIYSTQCFAMKNYTNIFFIPTQMRSEILSSLNQELLS